MSNQYVSDTPLRVLRRRWLCAHSPTDDSTCKGEMIAECGITNAVGTRWAHKCNMCGRHESAPYAYPRIVYEELEGERVYAASSDNGGG